MNFDKAVVQMPDGKTLTLGPAEFMAIPLGERITLMTGSKIKFYRNDQAISPLEAVKRGP